MLETVSLLRCPQTYAFLDALAACLEALSLSEEVKRDAIRFEGLRRRRAYLEQEAAAPVRGWFLLANLRYQRDETFAEAVESVRQVLRSVWRASSLVEGINSVVRMQQARHRCLTQGLLDLKRLYWNCRRFRTGRRRNRSPYELLGVELPVDNWWELLKLTPDQLRQQLSTTTLTE